MRSKSDMKNLIMEFALKEERIRTVLLNGSRANPNIKPDKFQDFDIVYMVRNFESFISDHNWTNVFGEKLIWQLPNEMSLGENDEAVGFSYLMLFKDGNRIDLTLFPLEKVKTDFKIDSLTIVWLDKDRLFTNVPPSNDTGYYIRKPTEKEFLDTCNEFWWVSTYVAKGLLRDEITYAKEMLETVVRPMFMKLIEWKIGVETDFLVSIGKAGRFLNKYLTNDNYNSVLATYADFDIENNWKSLFVMADLFGQFANELSGKLKFRYNKTEEQNTIEYLKLLHGEKKNHH
jgi:aminoglycoside 6-adenylyltransferase